MGEGEIRNEDREDLHAAKPPGRDTWLAREDPPLDVEQVKAAARDDGSSRLYPAIMAISMCRLTPRD